MSIAKKLACLILVIVLAVTLFVDVTSPILADQDNNQGSFSIFVFKDGEWQLQGKLSFSNYETLQMPLSNNTGKLKLRLVQEGHDAAFVDYVTVQKYGTSFLPTSAINIDDNTDVLTKIIYPDYDVCNGWDSMLEIVWDSAPEDAALVMRAMEEDLGEGHGAPFYYPWPWEHYTLSYLLIDDGGITVDGLLREYTVPDFRVFWQPYSSHPDGYTYGWIHCDNEYLYAAVEVTGDNTADDGDWGALYVMVDGKQKEFRISDDQTWGFRGFQYTSSVPYEHRIYEFKIPLSEINAVVGNEIQYSFGAYGTLATISLTFDTFPANTGSIVFDGLTYYDGDVYPLGWWGPFNIRANPAPGYVFLEWQVEGGIAVDNPYYYNTQLSLIDPYIAGTLRMVQKVQNEDSSSYANNPEHREATGANMKTTTVYAQPQQTVAGQPVIIFGNIANRGELAGSYTATLKINEEIEDIMEGTLSGNTAKPLEFTVYRNEPGTYKVDLNGQKTYFTIVGSQQQSSNAINPGVIFIIIISSLIILSLIVLLVRRVNERY
ncbi:hypothetical protein ACFLYM_01870 [Chloroflexota bacterium]